MKDLINLLKESIKLFYKNDSYLIEDNIHEQAISYRIAYYLENLMKLNNKYKKNYKSYFYVFYYCTSCKCIIAFKKQRT